MTGYSVLLVEDNLLVGMGLKQTLKDEGYEVELADSGKAAREVLESKPFDIAILDMMLPDANGQELLDEWKPKYPNMCIIFVTGHGSVELAVNCLKSGAYDFLTKPVEKPILLKTVKNAVDHLELTQKVEMLSELSQRATDTIVIGEVIGVDDTTRHMMDLAQRIANSDFSALLITGESGTGKGLLARSIHKMGVRASQPFVELNCAAMPAHLVESELFGHIKGSFTDAKTDKAGLFEMADKGTLFLDEIGDMEVGLQAKLLKAMEEQRFRRIGGSKEIKVNVAIIAATNQNIDKQIKEGSFRGDLYYRLNVIPLHLPPLRERKKDIEYLCEHFIIQFSRKLGKRIDGFSVDAMKALFDYDWPGNVRELRNVVERGCILTNSSVISEVGLLFPHLAASYAQEKDKKSDLAPKPPPIAALPTLPASTEAAPAAASAISEDNLPAMPLEDAEKQIIEAAMKKTEGNRNEAAKILGIHRTTLYKKLQNYGLDHL